MSIAYRIFGSACRSPYNTCLALTARPRAHLKSHNRFLSSAVRSSGSSGLLISRISRAFSSFVGLSSGE